MSGDIGPREQQLRALRAERMKRAKQGPRLQATVVSAEPVTPVVMPAIVTKPVTQPIVTRTVTRCSQCEMYAAEVKRLKLELAKARAGNVEPISDKERARQYRERKKHGKG